jgi:DNA-binding NarL/FixJ family response regulator
MDVSMPRLNGLKATQGLRKLTPEVKILILTRHSDSSYVRPLLQAGASGYVLKRSASEELVRAIQHVATGHMYLDPAITAQFVGVFGDASIRRPGGKPLSQREEQVLRFVALGLLTKEIAARLEISGKTVETHKAHAMVKMNMGSRVDIVRYAVLQGWLIDD